MDTATPATAHPLRPYYVAPPVEADYSLGLNSSSLRPPPPQRYDSPAATAYEDFGGNPAAGQMLRAFFTSSLLSFASTALVMPFEVGKTLAQVQWVPRDNLQPLVQLSDQQSPPEEAVDIEDEAEAEAYFSDLQSRPTTSFPNLNLPPRPTSPSGYLLRSGVNDEALGTKPEWIMPVVVQGGVWDMMRAVGKWNGEGWSSLWKGQLTTCIQDATSATIQPLLLSTLTVIIFPTSSAYFALSSLPLIHSPRPVPLLFCSVLSHVVTTVFLSPLDLIRTRLIVQSAQPQHRKYNGPLHAIKKILEEEGGLWTTYFHPHLLVPALLEGIFRPLLFLSSPLIISRFLRIEPSSSPVTFALAELFLGTFALIITIPIETIRKRLQIQIRAEFVRGGRIGGIGKAWRTCVEVRPKAYNGVVEAIYRIITEEAGHIPRRRRRSQVGRETEEVKEDLEPIGLGVAGGVRQLYRGFGMGVTANVVVFVLGLVAGGGDKWTEM